MEQFSSFTLYKAIRLKKEKEAIRLLSAVSDDDLKRLLLMPLAFRQHTKFLHLIAKYGASKTFKQVLSRIPPDNKLQLLRWKSDCTVLHVAVEKGHKKIIRVIFEEIKDKSDLLNLLLARAVDGRTVLHVAVVRQTLSLFQLLVKDIGMDNKEKDQQSWKKVLLVKDDSGSTVLHLAVQHQQTDIIKWILGRLSIDYDWKSILLVKDDSGSTVLHLAVQHKQTNIIKWILDRLKSTDFEWKRVLLVRNDEGTTLLHGAIAQNSVELITIFMNFMNDTKAKVPHIFNDKVDVLMAKNDEHLTVMQMALQRNGGNIISTMMENFTNSDEVIRLLSASCCSGETLIEYIVRNSDETVLKCMLGLLTVKEKNQLLWTKNFKGETLHEVAACRNDQSILACFEDGTSPSSTGRALKLFHIDGGCTVDVCEETVGHLASAAGNRPVLVVAIVGCSREDKSRLMQIINGLLKKEWNSGWSVINSSTIQDFLDSMSLDARTEGVDIWSEPLIFSKNDEEIAILLMHCESPADSDSSNLIWLQRVIPCDIKVTFETRNSYQAMVQRDIQQEQLADHSGPSMHAYLAVRAPTQNISEQQSLRQQNQFWIGTTENLRIDIKQQNAADSLSEAYSSFQETATTLERLGILWCGTERIIKLQVTNSGSDQNRVAKVVEPQFAVGNETPREFSQFLSQCKRLVVLHAIKRVLSSALLKEQDMQAKSSITEKIFVVLHAIQTGLFSAMLKEQDMQAKSSITEKRDIQQEQLADHSGKSMHAYLAVHASAQNISEQQSLRQKNQFWIGTTENLRIDIKQQNGADSLSEAYSSFQIFVVLHAIKRVLSAALLKEQDMQAKSSIIDKILVVLHPIQTVLLSTMLKEQDVLAKSSIIDKSHSRRAING